MDASHVRCFEVKKPFNYSDFARIVFVSDPHFSPSGDKIIFVTTRVDIENDCYLNSLWLYDFKEERYYVVRNNGYWPRWASGGHTILFVSEENDHKYILWTLDLGGDVYKVYETRLGIFQANWCGDHIIFVSPVKSSEESEVYVIRRYPIWFDGKGFIYNVVSSLYVLDRHGGSVERLTDDTLDVRLASPSRRGDKVAITAAPIDESNPFISYIYIINIKHGVVDRLTDKPMYISSLSWSPDDNYIIFRGHDFRRGFATHETIWILNVSTLEMRNLTENLGKNSSKRIYCDVRGPYGFLIDAYPLWADNFIYFPVSDSGRYNVYRINVKSGEIDEVLVGNFVVESFDVHKNIVVYVRTSDVEPCELWLFKEGENRQITNFNRDVMERFYISAPERFAFTASDGVPVEGWLMKPQRIEGKAPAIINIHGGPKSAFGYAFMFEHQLLAAKGYVVIYLNPRGSDGYSEEFADIRGKYGTRDLMDIMEAMDYLTSKYDFIDPNRLGVTGISYGGFMTNWIVTQTDRFKAAVSQNGISDWVSMFQSTDIGPFFCPDQIGGDPWTNNGVYAQKSPITYAKNVKTPILFIHTIDDYRCWVDQAIRFYISLKYLNKETELVLFKSGGHVFGWTGKPKLRVERLKHMIRWFDKYLKKG